VNVEAFESVSASDPLDRRHDPQQARRRRDHGRDNRVIRAQHIENDLNVRGAPSHHHDSYAMREWGAI
jgi:hypothetical protein